MSTARDKLLELARKRVWAVVYPPRGHPDKAYTFRRIYRTADGDLSTRIAQVTFTPAGRIKGATLTEFRPGYTALCDGIGPRFKLSQVRHWLLSGSEVDQQTGKRTGRDLFELTEQG